MSRGIPRAIRPDMFAVEGITLDRVKGQKHDKRVIKRSDFLSQPSYCGRINFGLPLLGFILYVTNSRQMSGAERRLVHVEG